MEPRRCIHRCGCETPAARKVAPYWLCEEHAIIEEDRREKDRARIAELLKDPSFLADARAEQELEGRVS